MRFYTADDWQVNQMATFYLVVIVIVSVVVVVVAGFANLRPIGIHIDCHRFSILTFVMSLPIFTLYIKC